MINYTIDEVSSVEINILKNLGEKGLCTYYKVANKLNYQSIYNIKKNELRIEEKLLVALETKKLKTTTNANNINLGSVSKNLYENSENEKIYETGLVITERFQKIQNEIIMDVIQINDHFEYNIKLWVKMQNKKDGIIFAKENRIQNFGIYNKGLDTYFDKLNNEGKDYIINILKNNDIAELQSII
jgi:hypothetical protein